MKWAILASGPSMTREDAELVRHLNVMVINTTFLLAPWADVLYACDGKWWRWNADGVKGFKGKKYTRSPSYKDFGAEYIKSEDKDGLSKDPNVIYEGSNSGIQAINLAYHLGAREIILLGFDMKKSGNASHWHEDHVLPTQSKYGKWLQRYAKVAVSAQSMGLNIINCTRSTALECFDVAKLEDVL